MDLSRWATLTWAWSNTFDRRSHQWSTPVPESQNSYQSAWGGEDRRQNREPPPPPARVKFDATINLGHVLTFAGFIIAGFTAWGDLDKRLTIIEERAIFQAQIDRQQDARLVESMVQIKESLGEIKSQVNRLAERPAPAAPHGQPGREQNARAHRQRNAGRPSARRRGPDDVVPDADDGSMRRTGVLT